MVEGHGDMPFARQDLPVAKCSRVGDAPGPATRQTCGWGLACTEDATCHFPPVMVKRGSPDPPSGPDARSYPLHSAPGIVSTVGPTPTSCESTRFWGLSNTDCLPIEGGRAGGRNSSSQRDDLLFTWATVSSAKQNHHYVG